MFAHCYFGRVQYLRRRFDAVEIFSTLVKGTNIDSLSDILLRLSIIYAKAKRDSAFDLGEFWPSEPLLVIIGEFGESPPAMESSS
jgi:hypothetical protein